MTREQLLLPLAALLILAGGVFGGGPVGPELSGFVELIACGVLGLAIVGLVNGECPRQAYPALALILLVGIIPLLQLIPLPPSMWRTLPGHAVPDAISQLAGQGGMARPLSLSPEDTRMHALSLIVPFAMFLATLQLDTPARDRLIIVIVGFAFVSAILGVFQVLIGNQLYLYDFTHLGYPVGFFANRNHEGDLLLIALPLSVRMVASFRIRRDMRRAIMIGLVLFFTAAVVATQSRSALVILPAALLGAYVTYEGRLGGRQFWMITAGLVAIAVLGALVLLYTSVGQHVLDRFNEVDQDLRPQIWKGTIVGIQQYWPTGSGLGSFVPVYRMIEDLNFVKERWVNHAHDEYLEILLETGLAGAILLATYAILFVVRMFARTPDWLGQHKWAAFTGIMVLLLHSLTDYPMRTFGLVAIFAFLNGLLFPSTRALRVRRERSHPVDPQPDFLRPSPEPAG
jgi:O-antigen ligase